MHVIQTATHAQCVPCQATGEIVHGALSVYFLSLEFAISCSNPEFLLRIVLP